MRPNVNIFEGKKISKVTIWQRKYFIVEISKATVGDFDGIIRTSWSMDIARHPADGPSTDVIKKLKSASHRLWSDIDLERVRRSVHRIDAFSELARVDLPRRRAEKKKMRKNT